MNQQIFSEIQALKRQLLPNERGDHGVTINAIVHAKGQWEQIKSFPFL